MAQYAPGISSSPMSSSLKRSLPPSSPAQPLPSSSPPLGIVEKQSVINLINVLGACVKCKGALKTAKTYDFAQAFSIIAVCHVYSLGYRFDSSSSVSINQKEVWDVPQRVIKTAILEGMTFEEYSSFFDLLGMDHYEKTQFHTIQNDVEKPLKKYTDEQLWKRREIIRPLYYNQANVILTYDGQLLVKIPVVFDARWTNPRGYNSEECTVNCAELISGKEIYRHHLIRKRGKGGVSSNYEGSAKAMEGVGVVEICDKMKKDGFAIEWCVHDGDASTWKHVKEAFPCAKEARCLGHAAKTFRDKVVAVCA